MKKGKLYVAPLIIYLGGLAFSYKPGTSFAFYLVIIFLFKPQTYLY
ncbi:hypothetical protein SAMN05421741_1238 [Paenimyroides ummariense]|uniref:Uncharacterized protein n=1 Tax=Paenimyroides ummariense TaxID=913024 RepID=A0A1I5EW67_9FLAO|nr:hypothetical protein SAMN05421741_1238 [Paenimyroides ummariense]